MSVYIRFVRFSSEFQADPVKTWAKENLKFGPAGPDPTTLYLIQLCGVLCGGLNVCKHAARVNGKRAPVLGLPLDAWGAITWGACCYLNWSQEGTLVALGSIRYLDSPDLPKSSR